MRPILIIALTLLVTSGGGVWADGDAPPAQRPWTEQAFLGLSLRDTPAGTVVGWIRPGPLGGRGFDSREGIRRGDNLVSVDGQALDAAGVKAYLSNLLPGTSVTLVLRRSPDARSDAAVPRGGAGGAPFEVKAILGQRAAWGGLMGRGLDGRRAPEPMEGAFEARILALAAEVGVRAGPDGVGGGLDALLPYLAGIQRDALDPNALPAVMQAFERPLSVDAVEARLFAGARAAAAGGEALRAWIRQTLDLPSTDALILEVMEAPAADLTPGQIHSMVRFAGQHLTSYQRRDDERRRVERLVETLRGSVTIGGDARAEEHVRTLTEVTGPGVDVFLALPLVMLRLAPAAWEAHAATHAEDDVLTDVAVDVSAIARGICSGSVGTTWARSPWWVAPGRIATT